MTTLMPRALANASSAQPISICKGWNSSLRLVIKRLSVFRFPLNIFLELLELIDLALQCWLIDRGSERARRGAY